MNEQLRRAPSPDELPQFAAIVGEQIRDHRSGSARAIPDRGPRYLSWPQLDVAAARLGTARIGTRRS